MKPTTLLFIKPRILMKALMLFMILMLSQGCSSLYCFVTFRPLFVGLDESGLSAKARAALAEARYDFALARKDKPPQYARLVSDDPLLESKTYQGRGYQLTIFNGGGSAGDRVGQKILIEPVITGGAPYRYDESHVWRD